MKKNNICFRKYFLLLSVLFLSSMYSSLQAQDLLLTNHAGVTYHNQPSLANRMSGVKKIYVFYPNVSSQNDRYIYKNFIVYLQRLGLQVIERGLAYKQVDASQNGYSAYILSCTEDITPYLDGVNVLAVVINIMHGYGSYTGERMSASFNFWDPTNNYTWFEQIEPASNAEKYIKQCQNKICSYYSYNSSYTYQPPYISSNYSNLSLRSYIDKGQYSPIEGIYEGDDYTLGVKKASDGSYYLIYHSSKEGAPDWQDGYVKAVLRETSTAGVYRGTWYGRYFTKFDYKIIFENGMFSTYDENNDKEVYLKMYPISTTPTNVGTSSGTGFLLSTNGFIITNYHVIDGARNISVSGLNDDNNKKYSAQVEVSDKQNDLAIIKITDPTYKPIVGIPYTFKFTTSSVGEDCFVLGYPLISSMGIDIKLTNGIISSKTGFDGNIAQYQISAPVQPGNSGGPLFDKNGNVIGIVQAKHTQAENAGYAIKASYIRNLVELLPASITFPQANQLAGKSLPQQVEKASKCVVLIMCE